MRKLFILIALLPLAVEAQQKQPDTSKRPKVYWSDLINIQNVNAELSRRINQKEVTEKISGYRLKQLDTLMSYIGSALPVIYNRTYADTVKGKGGKKP